MPFSLSQKGTYIFDVTIHSFIEVTALGSNLHPISQYPVSGMTATVLASTVRSHPGFLKSDFLGCFSFKELPSEALPC